MTDTDTDDDFPPPKSIGSLEEVSEFWRDCYLPAPGGGFRLHPTLAARRDEWDAMVAESARKIAELNAERERLDAQLRDIAKRKAVEKALDDAGVTFRQTKIASAYLLEKFKYAVHGDTLGDMVVAVVTPLGEISVAAAVGGWLTSEDGQCYRPPINPKSDGHFAGLVRGLSAAVH